MGRFRWLEMDGGPPRPEEGPDRPGEGDADENTCLAEADKCLRLGEYESALKWYSRCLRYAVDVEAAWFGQVICLLGLDEYVEANIWAGRALERFPNSPDILAAKALAVARTHGRTEAMAYSDASLTVKGATVGAYPWIARGELLLNSGASRQSAERCFNQALAIGGGDWYTNYLVGGCFLRKGMEAEALRRFTSAEKLERGNVMVLLAIGGCHERLGDIGAARDAYRRALNSAPQCKAARMQLAGLDRVGLLGSLWRRLRR